MLNKGKRMKTPDKKEQFKKLTNLITRNTRNIIIISSIILVIAIIGVLYAFFIDMVRATPIITSGFVAVQLEEDSPFDIDVPEDGADTTIKTFRAVSTGNVDCYVRAKIIPIVEYYDIEESAWVVANISVSDIELEMTAPDWIESNGYYYYKDILISEATSTDFIVEITNINMPDNLKTEKIRATIKVILESAQYDYDAWENIFNISELPDGVEKTVLGYITDGLLLWLDGYEEPIKEGDIYYWKDKSENGNDLELINYTNTLYNSEKKCIEFNGTTSGAYGITKEPIDFSSGQYTVILIMQAKRTATEFYYSNREAIANGISFLQYMGAFRVDNGLALQAAQTLNFNKLQIANTYDKSRLKYYQNANLVNSTASMNYSTVNMNVRFHIARYGGSATYECAQFDCYQVLVYNRPLTEKEINEIYKINRERFEL